MVAWPTVCKPTHLGGLGISDLKLAGYALQTRWLWLQHSDQDRAWSQLPIKTVPQVQAFFEASTFTQIGDDRRTLFWQDRWIDGESVSDIAPYIYQLVPRRVRKLQTVRDGLNNRTWARCISGGLSIPAIFDYLHLWHTVENTQLDDRQDRIIWRWTAVATTQPNLLTTCCMPVPCRSSATDSFGKPGRR